MSRQDYSQTQYPPANNWNNFQQPVPYQLHPHHQHQFGYPQFQHQYQQYHCDYPGQQNQQPDYYYSDNSHSNRQNNDSQKETGIVVAKPRNVLQIKDPTTKKPIKIDSVAALPVNPTPQPVVRIPDAPAVKVLPTTNTSVKTARLQIIDPATRKEVTPDVHLPAPTVTPSPPESVLVSCPDSNVTAGLKQNSSLTISQPASSSSNIVRRDSTTSSPAPVHNPANELDVPPPAISSSQATIPCEPIVVEGVSTDAVSIETENLKFAPGATWKFQSQNLDPLPRKSEVSSSSGSTEGTSGAVRRFYAFDFMMSVGRSSIPAPAGLKESDIYSADNRLSGDFGRNDFGANARTPSTFGGKLGTTSPFSSDIRRHMGNAINNVAPAQPDPAKAYLLLDHKAEDAFDVKKTKDVTSEEKVLKKVRGILNRISPDKYDQLFEQLWEEMHNALSDVMGLVERVIDTVFDVALDQPSYSNLYAEVCYNLCRRIQNEKERCQKESPKGADSKEGEKETEEKAETFVEFRRMLLSKCQARFEEGSTHKAPILDRKSVV